MLNKAIYYKDIADTEKNISSNEIQKIIIICNNVLSSIKEIKKDINEEPVIGETTKNSLKNYVSNNGTEPFYPPLEFLGLFGSVYNIKLLNASRAIFSGTALSNKNLISLDEIVAGFDLKKKSLLSSKDSIKIIEYVSSLFKVFYAIANNSFGIKTDNELFSVIYPLSAVTYSQPINPERFNPLKIEEILEENRKIKAINKYYDLINKSLPTSASTHGYATLFDKHKKNHDDGIKDKGKKLSIYENIMDKNLMPINLRQLYKTTLFANLQILQFIVINGKIDTTLNPFIKEILKKNYKELISNLFKNYLITSNKKLKSLELLSSDNFDYKNRISEINDKYTGITF